MPYAPFHKWYPKIAEQETRCVTILPGSPWNLPPAHYSLLEMYCDEPGCDCRRVFLAVVSSLTKQIEAVIAYGWENPNFYTEWMGDDDPAVIKELKGPVLNMASPQSHLAPEILDMVQKIVLAEQAYVDRLKRHYEMFRKRVEQKTRRKRSRKKKKA